MERLSIIIPCYNEEKRVKSFAEELIKNSKDGWEIIFVDDGSKDNTKKILKDFEKKNKLIKILEHKSNRGKGAAIKTGVLSSKGDYIIFMDADGSINPKEISKMMGELKSYDIVIGSRIMPDSEIKTRQPLYRIFLGKSFNRYVNILFKLGVYDTLCGFKGFRRSVALEVFKNIRTSRWIFDVEILVYAKKMGFSIKQTGIEWSHKSNSKLSVIKNPPKMFIDVLLLYFSR